MLELLVTIISAAFTLIIILDPLLSVSMFINLTRDLQKAEMIRQAFVATGVAGILMLTFLIFNNLLFDLLGIELESFKVAGGIILFILGLQIVLGLEIGGSSAGHKNLESSDRIGKKSMAGVIIGTPVMCGPGTITTVMILGAQDGILLTLLAVILALLCIWLILIFSAQIKKLLGETVLVILSKIVGLLLTAIAVHTIWTGILGLISLSVI
ncbi:MULTISPECIES: MarC family protein [Methanocorpusculum]|jgi:multiple antibiotic resistance protein|uniref:MarC family protein n=1 Tax=Methanocorpusculum TaxID=2192 RepID=UPI0005B2A567|nr:MULTISPECIES: MarC family protein [Methanocorpusculum]MDD4424042.1 MarC family protein [Methanocorpusculum parvum]MDD2248301.1 MarC family protein [Methanocorpusculum sp.]MDD2802733.1 MarC family protein [Methanocorpusculum sp.]MDD3047010.1 MarC family protein [Methanocorpusculum sp.]MDD3911969.1 MarC family protein [Methanocorpusculum sp.]